VKKQTLIIISEPQLLITVIWSERMAWVSPYQSH